MSLKAFHIFFIATSFVLAIGVGIWGVHAHLQQSNVSLLILGIGSLCVGALLVFYGVKVLRTLRRL